jgi:hypothetical protein
MKDQRTDSKKDQRKLTDEFVARCSTGNYWDTEERGLHLRVRANGGKRWWFNYKHDPSDPEAMGAISGSAGIGDYPAVSLQEARRQARMIRSRTPGYRDHTWKRPKKTPTTTPTNPKSSRRRVVASRANGRLGGRPRTSAQRVFTYRWEDGDLSLIVASDLQDAINALDEIGPLDFRQIKPYTGREFALVFCRDAAGRLVLNRTGERAAAFEELCDEAELGIPDAIAEDDERYQQLMQLHAEANALAVQHVRDRLSPEDLAALDDSHPGTGTRARAKPREELERALKMTLPQMKRYLKREARATAMSISIWTKGGDGSDVDMTEEYKRIDAMTEADMERGHASARAQLEAMAKREAELQS